MKQEAFMNWEQIDVSWKQLKDKIVFRWGRLTDDNGKRVDLIGAEMSRDSQSGDAQPTAFRPDDHGKRSEFSQHIGC
jgi:uncharacterized protein YjbJ (UPF0337 family)